MSRSFQHYHQLFSKLSFIDQQTHQTINLIIKRNLQTHQTNSPSPSTETHSNHSSDTTTSDPNLTSNDSSSFNSDSTHQNISPNLISHPSTSHQQNILDRLFHFHKSRLHPIQLALSKHLHAKHQLLRSELALWPNRISKLTGYGEIDKLKSMVATRESDLASSRQEAVTMKKLYSQAADRRAASVKEVNDLLARKASW